MLIWDQLFSSAVSSTAHSSKTAKAAAAMIDLPLLDYMCISMVLFVRADLMVLISHTTNNTKLHETSHETPPNRSPRTNSLAVVNTVVNTVVVLCCCLMLLSYVVVLCVVGQ